MGLKRVEHFILAEKRMGGGVDSYGIPADIPLIPFIFCGCCSCIIPRLRCCSSRCIVAAKCEFSTYKSLTSRSALVNRCDCSVMMMFWVSRRVLNSLISTRCCCHVSTNKKINQLKNN